MALPLLLDVCAMRLGSPGHESFYCCWPVDWHNIFQYFHFKSEILLLPHSVMYTCHHSPLCFSIHYTFHLKMVPDATFSYLLHWLHQEMSTTLQLNSFSTRAYIKMQIASLRSLDRLECSCMHRKCSPEE